LTQHYGYKDEQAGNLFYDWRMGPEYWEHQRYDGKYEVAQRRKGERNGQGLESEEENQLVEMHKLKYRSVENQGLSAFERSKKTIEDYRKKFAKGVILISISMGGAYLHNFLAWIERDLCGKKEQNEQDTEEQNEKQNEKQLRDNQKQLGDHLKFPKSKSCPAALAWKKKHIARWISLSGVFGGTSEMLSTTFAPSDRDMYEVG
jgi:hypothetical protein